MADPDDVARAVITRFSSLHPKRKPLVRPNDVHEWVPLAGVVVRQRQSDGRGGHTLRCVALGTGMKCLPASKLGEVRGVALHDWHAEVVALRAFNHVLLEEASMLAAGGDSDLLVWRGGREGGSDVARDGQEHAGEVDNLAAGTTDSSGVDDDGIEDSEPAWNGQPFALRDDIELYMYCSEAPCGDASMELTMAAQPDATPWAPTPPPPEDPAALPGREFFSRLGIVRRKPARRDAPPTMSKSCSDKLALRQCTSLLSGVVSLLVAPTPAAYLRALVIPRAQVCEAACLRAFSASKGGRMAGVVGRVDSGWSQTAAAGGYAFRQLAVLGTAEEFEFSKASITRASPLKGTAAFGGAMAWNSSGLEESLDGGVLRGIKGYQARAASAISRRRMLGMAIKTAGLLGEDTALKDSLGRETYADVKRSDLLAARRQVKQHVIAASLHGWVPNRGDDDFMVGE